MPLPGFRCNPQTSPVASVAGAVGAVSASWSRVDANGDADMIVVNGTTLAPTFKLTSGFYSVVVTQTWRCSIYDTANGNTAFADVIVTLERDYTP